MATPPSSHLPIALQVAQAGKPCLVEKPMALNHGECLAMVDAFRQRGVPSYGMVPCIFTAEDLKGYHGIDERLSLENLTLGTKIILDLTSRPATA